jgi:hypothetical protein
MVDHVKQYKIPREVFDESEDGSDKDKNSGSEDSEEAWRKKIYKASGPDGKGWGDARQVADKDLVVLEELE